MSRRKQELAYEPVAANKKANTVRSTFLLFVRSAPALCTPRPVEPGKLRLSNPHFGMTHVEAVITANADCNARDEGYVSTLELTCRTMRRSFIDAPPGADVCWRRDRDPDQPVAGLWTPWDRAYLAPGRTLGANI